MGPIPFTAIVEYARVYNIEELEDFIYYIRRLDNIYIESERKKNGKNNSDKSNKSNN